MRARWPASKGPGRNGRSMWIVGPFPEVLALEVRAAAPSAQTARHGEIQEPAARPRQGDGQASRETMIWRATCQSAGARPGQPVGQCSLV